MNLWREKNGDVRMVSVIVVLILLVIVVPLSIGKVWDLYQEYKEFKQQIISDEQRRLERDVDYFNAIQDKQRQLATQFVRIVEWRE